MKRKSLPKLIVNEELWHRILEATPCKKKVDSLASYMCGYGARNIVYYIEGTDSDRLIAEGYLIYYLAGLPNWVNGWKQYIVRLDRDQEEPVIEGDVGPIDAWIGMHSIINSKYSEDEQEEIYKTHECEEKDAEILHYNIVTDTLSKNYIYKFRNCSYYDLNGAYATKDIELFPRCADRFDQMFTHRHDNYDKYKKWFNYFTGMMTQNAKNYVNGKPTREIHPKTRFWIIKSITDQMYEGMKIEGINKKEDAIYVNTDGFIVQHGTNKLKTSDKRGEFKLEYKGDIYMLRVKAGWIMQYGDEIKGSIPLCIRKQIDLRTGKAVDFDYDKNHRPINIKETKYETIEIN